MPGPFYFAWAGGAIQEQVTVVTTGSTHGGGGVSFAIVGDVGSAAGPQQIRNVASSGQLKPGFLYNVTGPGLVDGTWFLYDSTVLAGDGINLSTVPTGAFNSATFSVTESIPVATIVGSLTQTSSTVIIGPLDLAPGVYTIAGTGIGVTAAPEGILVISTAFFVHDGSSETADMMVLAAYPSSTTGSDSFGQPVTRTTYAVVAQEVRATTSGDYALQIGGLPGDDAYRISNIPGMTLGSLLPGSLYNITGNGIPIGATFVAPSPGATEIFLDLPTSASNTGTLLTIDGPRTPNAASFDSTLHARFDEEVLGIEISQEEGNFATLNVDLKNPSAGLLAAGRNVWCWLSWDAAWAPEGNTPDLVPLFNGRLVGIPRRAVNEVVQLQFLARPDDYNYQKGALVDQLRVFPYYDPVWLAANVSDDTVLEAYSMLWHVDRVSLELTASDILQGEDGTIEIDEGTAFYEEFSLDYNEPPLVAVTVSGTVTWNQQADGVLEVTQPVVTAFANAGSPYPHAFARVGNTGGGGLITVLCGDGLKSDWPKPGTNIGGGWSLTTRNDDGGVPYCYIFDASQGMQGGWIKPEYYSVRFSGQQPPVIPPDSTTDQTNVAVFSTPYGEWEAQFPINIYKIRMALEYRADRKRTETVTAVITSDVQRVLSDSAEQDRESLSLTSDYVGTGIDLGGGIPIGNLAMRSYFQTERGALSYQYLLLAARAKMRARARAADVSFTMSWPAALGIGLRNSVTLHDRRLPGGVAEGKVKRYTLRMADGIATGHFTIGCCVGKGNPTVAAEGLHGYAEAGYANAGWDVVAGGQLWLLDGELAYQPLDEFVVVDDGLDLTNLTVETALNECFVVNGLSTQFNRLKVFQGTTSPTNGDPITTMKELTTTATLDMKPVAGSEFETNFYPAVSLLALPKTIDLEAPTS